MKILHLASEYPPQKFFGLGRYVHDVAAAQVRLDHDVLVLTNSLSGKDHDVVRHGVRIHRIHFPSPPKPPDGATQVTQFNLCLFERALELGESLSGPDAIVAHDWLTVLAAHQVRQLMGGRLILTVHDTVIGKTFGRLTNEDKFIANVERWGCRAADAVIAVSEHVRRELVGTYEAPADKVHVVPCGVDPAWFGRLDERYLPDLRAILADPAERIVAFVGRLDPEKGVDVLLEAFAGAAKTRPDVRLILAGKGALEGPLREQAEKLGLSDRVTFLGYVAGPALAALYRSADLVVCPSTYEPFGIVPLEAMVNGRPVVVSDTGGMAQIVKSDRSGLKVPPGDVRALEMAMGRLLDRPEEARRVAEAGRERALTVFGWDRVAQELIPIYEGRPPAAAKGRPKLTAGIRVKNGERFARECLDDLSDYADEIVILDDGSTDRTEAICRSYPKVTRFVRWPKNFFHEGIDRNVVLALIKDTNPDWILLPDIDEVFEPRFKQELPRLMADVDTALYGFLFCHFWRSRTRYRVDGKWGHESRNFPIPRLVRNQAGLFYPVDKPLGTAQIRGAVGRAIVSDIRVKHYGHLYEDLSREKVRLYGALDPGHDYSYMVDETGLELEEWSDARQPVGIA